MHSIAASIMCANQLQLAKELKELEDAKVELLHCDVMDGRFVHNLAMGPYVLEQIKNGTTIPLDIHLATEDPSKYIDMYSYIQPEYISFHVEASQNIERDIEKIKEMGIKPALALSPQSPIELIIPYLSKVEMILMMTVNPGFAGQKFNYDVLTKLDDLNKVLATLPESNRPLIEVDGCINKETIPLLVERGANIYVVGTSALFNEKEGTYEQKVERVRQLFPALSSDKVTC